MRSREQTCADEGRRYAPQYVHILASLRDVLKEDAAGWASRSHTGRVRFTPKSVVLGALLQPQLIPNWVCEELFPATDSSNRPAKRATTVRY
jgi:hypothetical protein